MGTDRPAPLSQFCRWPGHHRCANCDAARQRELVATSSALVKRPSSLLFHEPDPLGRDLQLLRAARSGPDQHLADIPRDGLRQVSVRPFAGPSQRPRDFPPWIDRGRASGHRVSGSSGVSKAAWHRCAAHDRLGRQRRGAKVVGGPPSSVARAVRAAARGPQPMEPSCAAKRVGSQLCAPALPTW
jgi:hypothetical protein